MQAFLSPSRHLYYRGREYQHSDYSPPIEKAQSGDQVPPSGLAGKKTSPPTPDTESRYIAIAAWCVPGVKTMIPRLVGKA